jgi:hypothetical protein
LGWRPTTLLVRVRRYLCTASTDGSNTSAAQPWASET